MKGLVFSQFIDMVEDRFGPDLLERIIASADLPSGGVYSSLGTYDFEEMESLVGALSRETGTDAGQLIKAFGMHMFGRLVSLYPQFLEGEASTMTFVPKVENYIHHEVRKLYPDATLPSFVIEEEGSERLVFVYQSPRPLSDMAEGMLLGCVDHFGEDIELHRQDLPATDGGGRARFTLVRHVPGATESSARWPAMESDDGVPMVRRRWGETAALAAQVAAVLPAPSPTAELTAITPYAPITANRTPSGPVAAASRPPSGPMLAASAPEEGAPVEAAPPVDAAGLERTLGYLRNVLLERAAAELGPQDLGAIARAGSEIERTLGMLRRSLSAKPRPVSGPAPAASPGHEGQSSAVRQQIEQLEARLRHANEIRRTTEAISEQKTNELYQAKVEIENALGYLRAILDNMDDGLLVVALDGEIKLVNRRAQHLFGLEGLELLGMSVDNVFNERMVSLVDRCMSHPGTSGQRMDLTSPAGQPLSVVASSIRAGEIGKHIGTVMIVRDISAEVEAQKHRSITDMVVGMAHELNTPLGIIKTAVGIISEAARSEALLAIEDRDVQDELDSVVGATELIDGHTTRMGRLIEAFKKLSASQMTEAIVDVDLLELLQEIAEVMVHTDDRLQVQVACELDPMDRQWLGQPDHLTQVITALLANVAEHAYPSASDTFPVKLTLERDDQREVFVIGVRDFGVGMAHEQMLRIFDPFFTSKRGGGGASPGLGLSIVNNLVRAGLRGSIEVSSEVGNGTTFVVKVPLRLG
jgi:PAS domain S-box-containing protein